MTLYEKVMNIDNSPDRFKPSLPGKEFIKFSKELERAHKLSNLVLENSGPGVLDRAISWIAKKFEFYYSNPRKIKSKLDYISY